MSKRLEDFIRANKEGFDELEPGAGLWARIERELPPEAKKRHEARTFSLGFVMRVAATVIIVMGVSFVIFYKSTQPKEVDLAAINPQYAKQQMHYASLVESKRDELKSIAQSNPELYKEFSSEVAKVDSAYNKLSSELATSPDQEKILEAMIKNLQIQTQMLTQQLNIVEQYNQAKTDPSNEPKSI